MQEIFCYLPLVQSHIPTITEERAGLNLTLEKISLFQDIYWPENKKYAISEHMRQDKGLLKLEEKLI